MPYIITMFLGALAASVGSLVGRVLFALGFGFATYRGLDALVSQLMGMISDLSQDSIPTELIQWAGFLQIDRHITMCLSAVPVKLAINAMRDGKQFLTSGGGVRGH